jgi:carbon storage regulator
MGETGIVNGDIGITVIGIKGDRVRLGFNAPKEVCVDRQEIHERRLEFQAECDLSCEEGSVCK